MVEGQVSRPSSSQRGTTCKWRCGTDWPEWGPLALRMFAPGAPRVSDIARANSWASRTVACSRTARRRRGCRLRAGAALPACAQERGGPRRMGGTPMPQLVLRPRRPPRRPSAGRRTRTPWNSCAHTAREPMVARGASPRHSCSMSARVPSGRATSMSCQRESRRRVGESAWGPCVEGLRMLWEGRRFLLWRV